MYRYKFIKIEISKWDDSPKEDYHEIINECAEKGVGIGSIICTVISYSWI